MDRILLALALALTLNGCAVYTVASTATVIATGRSPTDHVATLATGWDCSTLQILQGYYWCEITPTYNQSGL